jgi:hypothetical protein
MMFKSTLLVSALLATVANAAILDNDAAASVVAASAAQRTRQLKGAKKGKSTDSPTPSPTKSAKKGKSSKKSSPTPAPIPEEATVSDVLVATVGQTAGEVELELSQQAIDTIPGRRNLVSSVTDPTTSVTATTTCVTEDCIEILTDGSAPDGATCYRCDIVYTGGDGSVNLLDLATDTTTSIEAGDFTATLNVIVVFEGSGGIVLSSSPSAAPSYAPSDAPSSAPSSAPSAAPSYAPSAGPSSAPSTSGTSDAPTDAPTTIGTPSGTSSGTVSGSSTSSGTVSSSVSGSPTASA